MGWSQMISFPMPFQTVPCSIWLPITTEEDAYGNTGITYAEEPSIQTSCCYAPGTSKPDTADDFEDGRPHGLRVGMTFYLPKTLNVDLMDALIACHPTDDSTLSGKQFKVVGQPISYSRANTPGDFSWCVEGVTYLG